MRAAFRAATSRQSTRISATVERSTRAYSATDRSRPAIGGLSRPGLEQLKPRLRQLNIGGDPAAWSAAGFAVSESATAAGTVRIDFASGEGILGWRMEGAEAADVDGLPLAPLAPLADGQAAERPHANGVTQIDHVVLLTPDLERTTGALEVIGVERRRVREVETDDGTLRQGFFRLGEVILEVISHPGIEPGPARFWASPSRSRTWTPAPNCSPAGSARSATRYSRDAASQPFGGPPASGCPWR
jgi:hypothetical protein